MAVARVSHTATLLNDGRVLVQGGAFSTTAELYDASTGAFAPKGSTVVEHRGGSTATRLLDGRVLVVGGNGATAGASAEVYDPATGVFTLTGHLDVGRSGHAATLLPDGRVLVVGGLGTETNACLDSAEVYDPATGVFRLTERMSVRRCSLWWSGTPVLPGGKVLVFGSGGNILAAAELFDRRRTASRRRAAWRAPERGRPARCSRTARCSSWAARPEDPRSRPPRRTTSRPARSSQPRL